jgi:Rieske Fe-S protein
MTNSDTAPAGGIERRAVLLGGGAATTVVLSGCSAQRASPPAVTTQPIPPAETIQQPVETADESETAPTSTAQVAPGTGGPQPLAKVADIPAGGGVIVQNVVLTKDQSGKVNAFSATCTHQGCAVTAVSGGTINCPCHGSKFDAASGRPVAGPASKPLAAVAVQQRDGAVYPG